MLNYLIVMVSLWSLWPFPVELHDTSPSSWSHFVSDWVAKWRNVSYGRIFTIAVYWYSLSPAGNDLCVLQVSGL